MDIAVRQCVVLSECKDVHEGMKHGACGGKACFNAGLFGLYAIS